MWPISKFCDQHPKIIIKPPTFTSHQHLCGLKIPKIPFMWLLLFSSINFTNYKNPYIGWLPRNLQISIFRGYPKIHPSYEIRNLPKIWELKKKSEFILVLRKTSMKQFFSKFKLLILVWCKQGTKITLFLSFENYW